MNAHVIALAVVGLIAVCLVVAVFRTGRSLPVVPYDGPDCLRLLADLNAHLDAYAASDPDLAPVFGPGAADHTTTNTEGDL